MESSTTGTAAGDLDFKAGLIAHFAWMVRRNFLPPPRFSSGITVLNIEAKTELYGAQSSSKISSVTEDYLGFTAEIAFATIKRLLRPNPIRMPSRTLILLGCVGILSSCAFAQSYVFGRADFPVGKEPRSLARADFNGDGIADLVVANRSDNTLSILIGKPDGTFSAKTDYATGPNPISVVVGDFNNDGILDIAVANENCVPGEMGGEICGPGTVSVLLGVGDGTFEANVEYPTGTRPVAIVAADLNADGKLDLITADLQNGNSGGLSVLLGNGDGTFGSHVDYGTRGPALTVIAADLNGDHQVDLIAGVAGGVSVLLGKGDGTFSPHSDFLVQAGGTGTAIVCADFNGDGKPDLAVAGGNQLNILIGLGDGSFSLGSAFPTGAGASSIVSADLDGDGILDLAVANHDANSVSVLIGNGDGTFRQKLDFGTGPFPSAVVVGDFNGDGKLDLAFADSSCVVTGAAPPCQNAGSVGFLLGIRLGPFVGSVRMDLNASPLAITAGDFNLDGNPDLATADQITDSVTVFLNNSGTFGLPTSLGTGHEPVAVLTGDFNGDGAPDLITVNEICSNTPCGTGSISELLGNGDGTFHPHAEFGVGVIPLAAVAGDFNHDGALDLAVVNNGLGSGNTVSVLLGNGDGTFRSQSIFLTSNGPVAIVKGDINQDGNLDLAVATSSGVSVLLGNGDGTFRSHVDYSTDSPPETIDIGDLNGDGVADLVVGTQGNVVSVLIGNGDGTFKPAMDFPAGGLSNRVVIGDFDGDGKMDIAVGHMFSTQLSVLFGIGNGTFRAPVSYLATSNSLSSVSLGMFEPEGGLELVGSDSNDNSVFLLRNPSFRSVSPPAMTFNPQGVGTTSPMRFITLSNSSGAAIKSLNITATAAGAFAVGDNCGPSLAPGTNCMINVSFTPGTVGSSFGSITITDSAENSPQIVPLMGTGVSGAFGNISRPNVQFAPQLLGTQSSGSSAFLTNSGNSPLIISSISLAGANGSEFAEHSSCPLSGTGLIPGATCQIVLTFNPLQSGSRTGSLLISDNSANSPQTISLFGLGADYSISAATGSNCPANGNCSTSATILAGQTATYALQVSPIDGFTGNVSLSCSGTPSPATCTVSPANVLVSGPASLAFSVSITGTANAQVAPPFYPRDRHSRRGPTQSWYLLLVIALFLSLMASVPSRSRRSTFLTSLVLLALLACTDGCGRSSQSSSPAPILPKPATTATITVTGTFSGTGRTVQLSLTITH